MQQSINATVSAARNAEGTLVAALLGAAESLDGVANDPVSAALARMAASAAGARARLEARRADALALLEGVAGGFGEFALALKSSPVEAGPQSLPGPTGKKRGKGVAR